MSRNTLFIVFLYLAIRKTNRERGLQKEILKAKKNWRVVTAFLLRESPPDF